MQEIKTRGIILGVFEPIQIDERRITLLPDDVILFYTDGVTEALSPSDTMFTTQRLVEVLRNHASKSAQEIANAIVDAYTKFAAGTEQSDDITFFVVKRVEQVSAM